MIIDCWAWPRTENNVRRRPTVENTLEMKSPHLSSDIYLTLTLQYCIGPYVIPTDKGFDKISENLVLSFKKKIPVGVLRKWMSYLFIK